MSTTTLAHGHAHDHAHDDGSKTTLGFWIYLMSDCIIFSVLFATYGVLSGNTAGGPTPKDLFELPFVFVETMLLLMSSFTFGLAMLSLSAGKKRAVMSWLAITFLLGAGFIGMEVYEFAELIAHETSHGVSAFLSSYFVLVGTHGVHVTSGLLWLAIMLHQIRKFGLDGIVQRRLACLSLFWHFLDLIWVCVFTFVYLRGVL